MVKEIYNKNDDKGEGRKVEAWKSGSRDRERGSR